MSEDESIEEGKDAPELFVAGAFAEISLNWYLLLRLSLLPIHDVAVTRTGCQLQLND